MFSVQSVTVHTSIYIPGSPERMAAILVFATVILSP